MAFIWILNYLPNRATDLVFPRQLYAEDLLYAKMLIVSYYVSGLFTAVLSGISIYMATTMNIVPSLITAFFAREWYVIFSRLSPLIDIAKKVLRSSQVEKFDVRCVRNTIISINNTLWLSKIPYIQNGLNQVINAIPNI